MADERRRGRGLAGTIPVQLLLAELPGPWRAGTLSDPGTVHEHRLDACPAATALSRAGHTARVWRMHEGEWALYEMIGPAGR